MIRWIILGILIWLALSTAHAVTLSAKHKYPYPLLTEDHKILNERDLAVYTWGLTPRQFTDKEPSGDYYYWQCFPREQVSVTFIDSGITYVDLGSDTAADLEIRVAVKPGVYHEYGMRRGWTVAQYQTDFTRWHKLMKNEKYVCLAGSFIGREETVENDIHNETYGWIFEAIKTKKGCDSYFGSCTRTYKQYLKEEAESRKLLALSRLSGE